MSEIKSSKSYKRWLKPGHDTGQPWMQWPSRKTARMCTQVNWHLVTKDENGKRQRQEQKRREKINFSHSAFRKFSNSHQNFCKCVRLQKLPRPKINEGEALCLSNELLCLAHFSLHWNQSSDASFSFCLSLFLKCLYSCLSLHILGYIIELCSKILTWKQAPLLLLNHKFHFFSTGINVPWENCWYVYFTVAWEQHENLLMKCVCLNWSFFFGKGQK